MPERDLEDNPQNDGLVGRNIREGGLAGELRNGDEFPVATDYVVRTSEQIKSATDNTGAFSQGSLYIRHAPASPAKRRGALHGRFPRTAAGADALPQNGVNLSKLRCPPVAEAATCYNTHHQDIKRRFAETQIAPTEWNTTVVAEEAMCPTRETCSGRVARLDHKKCDRSFAGELSLLENLGETGNDAIIDNRTAWTVRVGEV